ncbi:MAG: proton-conducting transporter membrane subunit [Gammaproteobacteria bacterium]|nr:proton-conducting transporter membrane subunit [Gammaproteobacteria bacterium]
MIALLLTLAIALPLLAASWIAIGYSFGWNRGEQGERETSRVALTANGLSLLSIILLDFQALTGGFAPQIHLGQWFASGDVVINLSFTLDRLGLIMTTLIATITLLTIKFSINYMHREAGYQRFFMILSLFSSAMLLIVAAGNGAMLFVGWEMAGVSSYLLIAYAFERPTAAANANRAFITNRIGDIGLIAALFFSFEWFGGIEWSQIAAAEDPTNHLTAGVVALAFLIAAFAKSAQFPFSGWISRALEGPTPSSAVFYGALMIHAGVYLVLRLQPLIEHLPWIMGLLIVIGAITTLYGYLGALVQSDVKSTLIFSTNAHVGLMFVFAGLGWFELTTWYLVAHAIWRSFQFLSAPAHVQMMNQPTQRVPAWLKRQKWLYSASLQRFWLDHIADWLLVKPTQELALDIHNFDDRVVNRMVGLSGSSGALTSLAQHEEQQFGSSSSKHSAIGTARGAMGHLLQWIASMLYWFEEHLVLKSGGEGLLKGISFIGSYIEQVEALLSNPRYLLLMIMATFVVII